MLETTVTLTPKVGVAPSTTTFRLPAGTLGIQCQPEPVRPWPPPPRPSPPVAPRPRDPWRFYVLYGAHGNGLGLVNETDAWLTGRPYGLPGTTALELHERDGRWSAGLVGADLGQQEAALVEVMRQQLEVGKGQEAALRRIAFWTAAIGSLALTAAAVSVIVGIARKA